MADDYGSSVGAGNLGSVAVGGSSNGNREEANDQDWFQITLVAGQSYIFTMTAITMEDPALGLLDANGVSVAFNDDANGSLNSQINFTATVGGTYYLRATSLTGTDTGTYTVSAAIDPNPPGQTDDFGSQAGAPNVGSVAIGGSTNGNLEVAGDSDWFAVMLTAGTSYIFRQDAITQDDPRLTLRDSNGISIAADDDGGGGFNSQISYTAVTTGLYYLEANTSLGGDTGTYTVSAVIDGAPPEPPVDDYGSQAGAGNLGSVAVGATSSGNLEVGGDHDWFAVTLSAGSVYRFNVDAGTLADPRFTLRNAIGSALGGDDDSGPGDNALLEFTATTSGVYYIDANSSDGAATGTYTVGVTLVYGAPLISSNAGSSAAEGAADTITAAELSTSDPDSAATAIIYTLTSNTANGTLTRNGMTLGVNSTFTQADINSGLLVYTHNGSETTSDSFGFSVSDGTTSITGQTFNLTVTPVNDAPVNTVPGTQAGTEDTNLVFSPANGNAISVSDVDATTLTVTLSVASGVLTLSGTAGLSFGTGDGSGDATMTFSGTAAAINAALNGLTYRGDLNFNGGDTLSVVTTDNGETGTGGTLTDTDTVTINLTPDGVIDGDAGGNALTGTAGADYFDLSQGGDDTVAGLGGDDGFYFGGTYTNADVVDGGAGNRDQIGLQGDYSGGVTLGSLLDTEFVVLLPGNDSRFGDTANNLYDYSIIADANTIVSNNRLSIQANTLRAGEDFTFNGSASSIDFLIYGGLGTDNLTGGAGNDGFLFGQGRFSANDIVNGGAGTMDQLGFQGNHFITFGANQLSGIEYIVLLSASDDRFGEFGGTVSYALFMNDNNVLSGERLVINANSLEAGETLNFQGFAETNGSFSVYSGAGNDALVGSQFGGDILFGGAGNDIIEGQGGADQLTGGAGDDTFNYHKVADSTDTERDHITDFETGDLINLVPIASNSGFANFSFIGSGQQTGAQQLRVEQNGNEATVFAYIDGDNVADLVINVTVADGHALTAGDFLGVTPPPPPPQEPLSDKIVSGAESGLYSGGAADAYFLPDAQIDHGLLLTHDFV